MSFVLRLPIEVVHDIFLLCTDIVCLGIHQRHVTSARKLHDYPNLVIPAVCRAWSNATLSCPLFWATISILSRPQGDYDELTATWSSYDISPPPSTIRSWIDRSQCAPLTIAVLPWIAGGSEVFLYGFAKAYSEAVEEIIGTVLLQHHLRWKSVTFRVLWSSSSAPFATLSSPSFYPQLEHISIRELFEGPDGSVSPWMEGVLHLLSHSPRLSSVALEIDIETLSRMNHLLLKSTIPWKQLTSISLYGDGGRRYSAGEVLDLLQGGSFSQLKVLSISMRDPKPPSTRHGSHLYHGGLTTLDLWHSGQDHFIAFLDQVTLPKLQALTIPSTYSPADGMDQWVTRFETVIPNFVRRSRCKIKKLHYSNSVAMNNVPSRHIVLPILRVISTSLTELRLDVGKEVDEVLRLLTVHDSTAIGDTLCPHLQHLEFCKVRLPLCSDSDRGKYSPLLVDLIESRWSCEGESLSVLGYVDIGLIVEKPRRGWYDEGNERAAAAVLASVETKDVERLEALVKRRQVQPERVRLTARCDWFCHTFFDTR